MQLELFPTVRVTAHIRQPNKTFQVMEVANTQGNLFPQTIADLHKQLKKLFPSSTPLILIQNV